MVWNIRKEIENGSKLLEKHLKNLEFFLDWFFIYRFLR